MSRLIHVNAPALGLPNLTKRRQAFIDMATSQPVTGARLRTPRAAAVAGVLFSVLLMTALVLARLSVPLDPLERGEWLKTDSTRVALALNLVPFAGVAFLWFMGVLRARLAELEDRFFATVFLGSGLLFLAMLFTSAAVTGAIILVHAGQPEALAPVGSFAIARALGYAIGNIYAAKMAAVFMFVTSTIVIGTRLAARWIAFLGFGLALFLLFGSGITRWSIMVFPLWVLVVSFYILIDNLRRPPEAVTAGED
jgi:hypothetical protein